MVIYLPVLTFYFIQHGITYSLSISSRTRRFYFSSPTGTRTSIMCLPIPEKVSVVIIISCRTHFLFLPARETIFQFNILSYASSLLSSRTGTHTRYLNSSVRETVAIVMYIPLRTGNYIRSQYIPVPVVFIFFLNENP